MSERPFPTSPGISQLGFLGWTAIDKVQVEAPRVGRYRIVAARPPSNVGIHHAVVTMFRKRAGVLAHHLIHYFGSGLALNL